MTPDRNDFRTAPRRPVGCHFPTLHGQINVRIRSVQSCCLFVYRKQPFDPLRIVSVIRKRKVHHKVAMYFCSDAVSCPPLGTGACTYICTSLLLSQSRDAEPKWRSLPGWFRRYGEGGAGSPVNSVRRVCHASRRERTAAVRGPGTGVGCIKAGQKSQRQKQMTQSCGTA